MILLFKYPFPNPRPLKTTALAASMAALHALPLFAAKRSGLKMTTGVPVMTTERAEPIWRPPDAK